MPTITRDVEIATSPPAVWSVLEDVRRLPEFSSSTLEVVDAPPRLDAVGQTYTQVGRLLGKRYSSEWTVTEIDPGRRIRSEGSVAPGVRFCLTQNLEAVGDGRSRLQIVMDYAMPGGLLGRLAAKAGVESRASREAQAVLEGVRSAAESGPG